MISTNNVVAFLNREIFTADEDEYKTNELYKKYKDWCNKEKVQIQYGRNKFYDLMKLYPRIKMSHRSNGDFFIFELDYAKDFKMPF